MEKGYFDSSPEKIRARWVRGGVAAALATGLVGYAWMDDRGVMPPATLVVPAAAGALTWVLFWLVSPAMPRRTEEGARARQWALGFQEFARRVEGDRLARSTADPRRVFEALLPYAMALGVSGEWARTFENIYAQQAPSWYAGARGSTGSDGFSTRSFERSLSTAMSQTGRNMTAAPRSSSGSGGGGFSGGGGGGGGGGSW